MKVLVLNGSPKGKYSITLQKILYLQKKCKICDFEILNVGQTIKQLEKDFGNAAYATIRGFVLKFEDLGLLRSIKYGNRNKYQVIS